MTYVIWSNNEKVRPPIDPAYNALLNDFSNKWYTIELGFLFEPDDGATSDVVVYHVVNNFTGVIEYQGSHLPSVIQMAMALDEAMMKLEREDELPALIN